MAVLVDRAPRVLRARHVLAAACAALGVGLGYLGFGDAAVAAAVAGLATLALRPSENAGRAGDPGLAMLRAIAGRSQSAERLEGAVAATLEELVRHAGGSIALALIRRGEGGLCDAYYWLDGRLGRDELLWQEELARPLEDGPGAPSPRLPTRLGRPGGWIARPIIGRGDVCGALLLLDPPSRNRSWLGVALTVLGSHVGAVAIGERFDERLERGYMATIEALVNALEAKDPYTAGHSTRVSRYALAIAAEMSLPEEQSVELQTGAVLHDIGKIGIGDGVLFKPGRLSEDEYDEIKDHPRRGARIIDAFNRSSTVLSIVFHHHERYDGRGYPAGLRGVDIPLAARIVNVADAFDAMTTSRPYIGEPRTRVDGIAELRRGAGTQFDPVVVEAFERALSSGRG
ncbi:MAG TPA: HD-GYP domain-containing protein [Chloroflexota bacterium]|jgi:putative nucleotidyltransferase with HDIG domain|nr:HD-GYP domain-containing protein [Chloroflexota bacterium]